MNKTEQWTGLSKKSEDWKRQTMLDPNISIDFDLLFMVQAFCNASRLATTVAHILAELNKIKVKLGIRDLFSAALPARRERLGDHVRLVGWNPAWIRYYEENDLIQTDPAIKLLRSARTPFLLSEACATLHLSEPERQVLSAGQSFDVTDRYIVPCLGGRMRTSFVWFVTIARRSG